MSRILARFSPARAVAVSIVLLLAPLCWPLVTQRFFANDDLGAFHIPVRYLYQQALQHGDSWLWTPRLHSGYYLFGEGQAGMAHPLHYALYRWLSLPSAFALEIASSYVVLLFGMRRLLRLLGLDAASVWFGALVFTFSGTTLLHLIHTNIVAVIAHLPWMLVFVHALLTASDRTALARAVAGVGVTMGSAVLLGNPQFILIGAFPATAWVVAFASAPDRRRRLPLLAVAVLAGLLVGGIQWLPTWDVLQASRHSGLRADALLLHSLEPARDGALFLSPRILDLELRHEYAAYNGMFCTAAFVWVAIRWRAVRSRWLIASLALAGFGLWMALGRYGGLYPLLLTVSGLDSVRVPARFITLFHLALAPIAALVLHDLQRVVRARTRVSWPRLAWLALVPAATLMVTLAWRPVRSDIYALLHGSLSVAQVWMYVVIAAATVALFALAGRGRAWAMPALVVVTALDLGVCGYLYVFGTHGDGVRSWDWFMTASSVLTSPPLPEGIAPGDTLYIGAFGNANVMRGYTLSAGYTGLNPTTTLPVNRLPVQSLAGVDWVYERDTWTRVPNPMPRARLLTAVRQSRRPDVEVLTIDVAHEALVTTPIAPLDGSPGTARVLVDRPGAIAVRTHADGRQLLTLTERFLYGWRATEDGRPIDVVASYGYFVGAVVSPGDHVVRFEFAPESYRLGRQLTMAGVVLLVLACGWSIKAPFRRSSPPAAAAPAPNRRD